MSNDGADGSSAADLHIHFGIDRSFNDCDDRAAEDITGTDLGIMQVGADDNRAGLDDGVRFATDLQPHIVNGTVGDGGYDW